VLARLARTSVLDICTAPLTRATLTLLPALIPRIVTVLASSTSTVALGPATYVAPLPDAVNAIAPLTTVAVTVFVFKTPRTMLVSNIATFALGPGSTDVPVPPLPNHIPDIVILPYRKRFSRTTI